jgi:Uma2 family endonuclease
MGDNCASWGYKSRSRIEQEALAPGLSSWTRRDFLSLRESGKLKYSRCRKSGLTLVDGISGTRGERMTTMTAQAITAAEFARMPDPPDGSNRELVRGVIVTMTPPGFRHGVCQNKVAFLLTAHVLATHCGRVTVESGLQTEFDPDTVRGPDVAFWSAERLPLDRMPEVYPDVAADLVVEIQSPSNTQHEMQEKVREYIHRGVQLVWVVDPEAHTVTVYRQPGEGRLLWNDATLTGEDVLPDFQCRVAQFFE